MAGCLSVTRRYCIKTAKHILKLFRPSGSLIILVSSDPCADTQFQGEPLQRGLHSAYTRRWEKLAIFDGNRRLSQNSETVRDRPIVTIWNVNRKSWVLYWMISCSMTLSDHNSGFKVTLYLEVEYLKNGAF